MSELLLVIISVFVVYFIGSAVEKKHYKKIQKREIMLIKFPIVAAGKKMKTQKPVQNVRLVTGCAVISSDYFKDFVAGLKTFFGGKLTTYESLMDRARREAVLRMRESAYGSDIIINAKIESINLKSLEDPKAMKMACVMAYGTAVTYAKQ